ncbi:UDP-glucose 4-epimerase GalE [Dolichospermum sp. ST_con]|nr:UDP-glucose 4-epimerase GalE [Dolichospermum sp. ST_con]MDD1418390.1 UDP-glucose 4-epimerase GalE [Dolichospermum sp. ST_sed1]MDD1425516.1 UDP-glucose 4-epimerase GalE [Dolichospermum sp. ST_sed9]MDD1432197.1 UDP-glucose 4-epimerase GalE [Dolichospermum sp. ST_sed6]MDD1441531.1 UDP-glucose 4-epimerase GalE [Dolichospermum sp. ST_sed3]MDD1447577.1 UDP-glucose 4-epimerase GalE [Dolichospermum sp. ST_sed8]MDD1455682.1 UDP-glucose 4-epimerase GalE [Dolichospermum sp. ST_sed7]MDD1460500.1 UDP-
MNQKVLVTGGAGYIGSHVVRQLGEAGYDVVVYDNCSTGVAQSVLYGELIIGDLGDIDRLYQVFGKHQFSAVLHFAASLVVPESVAYPLDYYANNTRNTLNLLRCCTVMGVNQLIFSSTAAVYGEPQENPVTEFTPTLPINPYGRSKLMSEWMIQDYGLASSLRYVILRYFNVAGADPGGRIGQNSSNATHLIANACNAALKRQSEFKIFGSDFPTPDGTGIRDYIHVEDLAAAHVDALRYLERDGDSQILNCGYGKGYSVRQVVERVKEISGVNFPVIEVERRPGDPACVTACAEKIQQVLNWQPKYNDLDNIIYSFLSWEKGKLLNS